MKLQFRPRQYSSFLTSLSVHAVVLVVLGFWQLQMQQENEEFVIDVEDVERVQEEVTRQLQEDVDDATSVNVTAGGTVTGAVGKSQATQVSKAQVEQSETLQTPNVDVNVGPADLPEGEEIAQDLGEGVVTGDIGAPVEGYGAALSRMAQELQRIMRKHKVLVVWMFDESESMKNDREEITARFAKVYNDLGVISRSESRRGNRDDILLSHVVGYGAKPHEMTRKPTADFELIRKAMEKVPIDDSGKENMCTAIYGVLDKYHKFARAQDRKIVVVVVSDESGDDAGEMGENLERAVSAARELKAPVYVMGRESAFGQPYLRVRWKDPQFGLNHWLRIRRGPETAYAENLQWNGFHRRHDSYSAHFGPYEQSRLVKETGGVFFILPSEETNLVGAGARSQRRFDFLDMKPYVPLLLSRRGYQREVLNTDFRKALRIVIKKLDPGENPNLNIDRHWYPFEKPEFTSHAKKQFAKAKNAVRLLSEVIAMLEKIRPLRDAEESKRWRAHYDLMYAQCLSYRIRLFQFMLAVDEHVRTWPRPENPKSNRWNVGHSQKLIEPDENQYAALQKTYGLEMTREEYIQHMHDYVRRSKQAYQRVIEEHPRTPWALMANQELRWAYGIKVHEAYRDPKYDLFRKSKKVKLPNL